VDLWQIHILPGILTTLCCGNCYFEYGY